MFCSSAVTKLVGMVMKKRSANPRKAGGALRKTDGELTRAIGRRVRVLRESAGWSQAELERRADLSVGTVNRLERDRALLMSIEIVVRLSEALVVPLDFLVYGKLLKHTGQVPLLSGDFDSVNAVWAMAPGGTRGARRLLVGRPARGVVRPPKSAIVQPELPAPRKRAKPRDP